MINSWQPPQNARTFEGQCDAKRTDEVWRIDHRYLEQDVKRSFANELVRFIKNLVLVIHQIVASISQTSLTHRSQSLERRRSAETNRKNINNAISVDFEERETSLASNRRGMTFRRNAGKTPGRESEASRPNSNCSFSLAQVRQ